MKSPVQQPLPTTRKIAKTAVYVLVYCSTLGCNDLLGHDREWKGSTRSTRSDQDSSSTFKETGTSSGARSSNSSDSDGGGRSSSSDTERSETSYTLSDADIQTSAAESDAGSTATSVNDSSLISSVSSSADETSSDLSTHEKDDAGTCTVECEIDDVICVLGARQTCELDEDGCLQWSEPDNCGSGLCENETTCLDCSQGGEGCPPCEGEACHIPIGQACSEGDVCAGGRCQPTSDGGSICCTASCDSACLACAPNGESCESLTDDAACGTVTCPADNPCRNYTAESVTNNRCVDGTCGSPDEVCPYVVRNDGEECSATHLCDTMGNCTVPKFALGAECDADSACSSDHCVDGVCCQTKCNGVCMECRAGTGQCDVTPVDDVECDVVECSRWNADCTRSLGNITTDHCAAFGQCKSELSCPIENRPRGTGCSGHMLNVCDGEGGCGLPTVECEQTTCLPEMNGGGISAGCCHHDPDFDLSALECRQRDECDEEFGDWSVECDEQADCRSGEAVCCGIGVNGIGWVTCSLPEECNIFSSPVGTAELCESPAMGAVECSNGGACLREVESLPGFRFCTRLETTE